MAFPILKPGQKYEDVYGDFTISTRYQSGGKKLYLVRGSTGTGSKKISGYMGEKELQNWFAQNAPSWDWQVGMEAARQRDVDITGPTGQLLPQIQQQAQQTAQGLQGGTQGGIQPSSFSQFTSPPNQAIQQATNLWQFYQAQGKSLPSVSQRAPLYQQYGGTGTYTGTAAQNIFLLGKLKQGLPQAQAPSSAGGITPTPTPVLPSGISTTGNISSAAGAAAGAGTLADMNIDQLTQQMAQFETQRQGLLQQFFNQQGQQVSRAELRAEMEKQYGIKAKLAEIETLRGEYNQKKAAMDTEVNNSSNRMATTGFISQEQNAIERKYAPTLNRISADVNSKMATVSQNQDLVNQAVSDAVADQKFKMDQAKMFLDANFDVIDRMEGIYKDAYKNYVKQQEDKYDRQYKEKTEVADLMMANPNAGITTNDTYEQAARKVAKAGGSLAARREARLGAGGGGIGLTRTEQKAFDSFAAEIGSYSDRESALADLQANRSSIIGKVGRKGYDQLVNEINSQLSPKTLGAPTQATTQKRGGVRNFLSNLFSVNPLSPVGPITVKPVQSFFNRLFGR